MALHIYETFQINPERGERLFWLGGYIKFARFIYDSFTRTGEIAERKRFVAKCATIWGITRPCADDVLSGKAAYELADSSVTIIRPVREE